MDNIEAECIKLAKDNQGITTEMIYSDLDATYKEIFQYEKKLGLFYGGRLDSGYKSHIRELELFAEKMKKILFGRELLKIAASKLESYKEESKDNL